MSFMSEGAAWLGEELKLAAPRVVNVKQGTTTLPGLTAWMRMIDYEVQTEEGFVTSFAATDWHFVRADLPPGFEFREGAIVTEGTPPDDKQYEATAIGERRAAEKFDVHDQLILLHTKQIR